MKPKSIGIVGGAGPLAGAYLLKRIFSLAMQKYGCRNDADFPEVFLISYPFSEMLSSDKNFSKIQNELRGSLKQLRKNGASILCIACNTLHAFLNEDEETLDLVHLPRSVGEEVVWGDVPVVLCTSTSKNFKLHKQSFPCTYPDLKTQQEVDDVIDQILIGADRSLILKRIENLIRSSSANTLILGCTELSLFANQLSVPGKLIIDPLELVVKKILLKSFSK